jgi:hypothetical protein
MTDVTIDTDSHLHGLKAPSAERGVLVGLEEIGCTVGSEGLTRMILAAALRRV